MIATIDDAIRVACRTETVVKRLKADLAYHQAERQRLAEEISRLEEPYAAETDMAESYHAGRVEALDQAIRLLLGEEVTLYSETETATA